MNLIGDTSNPDTPGVLGVSHSTASAVSGINDFAPGPGRGGNGAAFESAEGEGVRGTCKNASHVGVNGRNTAGGIGVFGESLSASGTGGTGVFGVSIKGRGVEGRSTENHAIVGTSMGIGTGVFGVGTKGRGVEGQSTENHAIVGTSMGNGAGVFGITGNGNGIEGHSTTNNGVFGESEQGIGVFGRGGKLAGFFEGDVKVTGTLQCEQEVQCKGNILMAKTADIRLSNADCAEDFDVSGATAVEPGTVMVLGPEGALFESLQPYDRRVAGVISGAGNYKPGIVLDTQDTEANRQPIALIGKTFCKVDAEFGPVEIGDLLTTSSTPGHAMKASDPLMAFGAVIGKALRSLPNGRALVPILIALQ